MGLLDEKGRLVLPTTREELKSMTSQELQDFRTMHVESGYGGLVQAADEELARRRPKYKVRRYTLWSYDVWGNAKDGFEVNDRYKHGTVTIRCKATVFNAGTPHEFVSYDPTDRQLSRATGVSRVEWDGVSDEGFFASLKSNGKPVCELIYEGDDNGSDR